MVTKAPLLGLWASGGRYLLVSSWEGENSFLGRGLRPSR